MTHRTGHLEFHPVSEIFPLMQGEQYDQLIQDIRDHGLLEPIWLHEGQIIDGRNRYRACLEANVEPETRVWNGDGSLVEFVVSLNLRRRHLTSSQRAAGAAEALDQLRVEAKERQREGGRGEVPQKIGEASKHEGEATHRAAKMFGTNRTYVAEAAKIRDEDESTFRSIMKGDLTIPEQGLIRDHIQHSYHAELIAELGLDARDRVTLARIAKEARRSGHFKFSGDSGLRRALDLFEDDDETTIKQTAKQVRAEIKEYEIARQQRREALEKHNAEEEEREWKEREPFKHFAEWLLGNTPGLNLCWSAKDYERLIRHMTNCKLTKLVAAVEKMKAEWDAEHEQERA